MASKSSKQRKKRRARARARSEGSPDAGGAERKSEPQPQSKRSRVAERKRSAAADERPPAPWGSFPLIELTVLIGIVMVVAGFVFGPTDRGGTFLVTGLVLASIGGLELSIREHFAGYRSHTAVLAGFPAAVVLALLFYLGPDGLPAIGRVAIAAIVFGVAAWALTRIFRARSGGLPFKFGGFGRG